MYIAEKYCRVPTNEESEIILRQEKKSCNRQHLYVFLMIVAFVVGGSVYCFNQIKKDKQEIEAKTQNQLQESVNSYDSYIKSAIRELYGDRDEYATSKAGHINSVKYIDKNATLKKGKTVYNTKKYKKAYNKYLKEYDSKIVEKDVITEMQKLGWKSSDEIKSESVQKEKMIDENPMKWVILVQGAGALIYLLFWRHSRKKKLSAYENKEYVVVPALYYGSESVLEDEDRNIILRFHYGDGQKYIIEAKSSGYFKGCSNCLIVKRFDNKKGFVLNENPDVVRID